MSSRSKERSRAPHTVKANKSRPLYAIRNSVFVNLTTLNERYWGFPVRIQWDPEKDIFLNKLDYRSIQVGLTSVAVEKYVNDWIVSIEDISEKCRNIHSLTLNKKIEEANQLLPLENIYPLPDNLKKQILYSS